MCFFCFFFFGGGGGVKRERECPNQTNTTINGPSSNRQPKFECWLGSFVIFQEIRTSIAKKPYIFVIFSGFPDPLSPYLDPPMEERNSFKGIVTLSKKSFQNRNVGEVEFSFEVFLDI